jgi:hypothetical protein
MIERPTTIEGRMAAAHAAEPSQRRITLFNDLPRKHLGSTAYGNKTTFHSVERNLLTSVYTDQFEENLGLSLRQWRVVEVAGNLQKCFPTCDALDCEYLEDVLSELQLPAHWSQNRSIAGPGERFTQNALRVIRWISQQRARLGVPPVLPPAKPSTGKGGIEATLPFLGTVSDLALILYTLERQGKIDLQAYRAQGGNVAALCRTLCRVLPPAASSSGNPAQALQLALGKIPPGSHGPGPIEDKVLINMGRKRETTNPIKELE